MPDARVDRREAVLFLSTLGFTPLAACSLFQAKQDFGVVEVGAQGVKTTALRLDRPKLDHQTAPHSGLENETSGALERLGVKVDNPDAFDDANIDQVVRSVEASLAYLKKSFGIGKSRLLIVGSSGVQTKPHARRLAAAVERATGVAMPYVSPADEGRLGFEWVIPGAYQIDSVLLDIGSSNTKGGYLEYGGSSKLFQELTLPNGTKTYARQIADTHPGKDFLAAALEMRPALEERIQALAISHPEMAPGHRASIYMIGGIVWAVATLVRPDAVPPVKWDGDTPVLPDEVRLNPEDFTTLRSRIASGAYQFPDIPAAMPAKARNWYEGQVKDVLNRFDSNQLLAGLEICSALSTRLDFARRLQEGGKIAFIPDSVDGWSAQYLVEQAVSRN